MKKTLSALLVGSMLMFPVPTLAADSSTDPEVLKFLAFNKIEDEIEKRSPVLEILLNTRNITDEQFDAQEDQIRKNLSDAASQLEKQITSYQGLVDYYNGLKLAEEGLGLEADSVKITLYAELAKQYQMQKDALVATLNSSENSSSLLDDMEENLDQNKKYALRQLSINTQLQKDSLVIAIQRSFLGYQTLNDSMAEMTSQKELIERQLSIMKLQQSLGIVTASNDDQLELSIENMDTTLDTLNDSLGDIKANINLLLGQPYDTPLTLGAIPELDKSQMSEMDYESDYEMALDNNYNIRIQQVVYATKDYAADYAEDEGTKHEERIAEDERDNAIIQLDSLERKLALTFDQAYRNVQNKSTAVDLSQGKFSNVQTTWQQTQLKYDLGLISKLDMEKVKTDYETEKQNLQSALQELFAAFTDYQWVIYGMDITV